MTSSYTWESCPSFHRMEKSERNRYKKAVSVDVNRIRTIRYRTFGPGSGIRKFGDIPQSSSHYAAYHRDPNSQFCVQKRVDTKLLIAARRLWTAQNRPTSKHVFDRGSFAKGRLQLSRIWLVPIENNLPKGPETSIGMYLNPKRTPSVVVELSGPPFFGSTHLFYSVNFY